MTREEAKQNLIALGIENPTDAQVTNYLNQFHSNRPQPNPTPHPNPAPQPNPTPQPAPQPGDPNQDDEIQNLTQQIEQLKRENVQKDIRAYAAEKGLTGEQAETILSAFQSDLELAKKSIDSMSEIISAKEAAAAQAKEQEIAAGSTNPGGGTGNPGDEGKTNAEKIASKMFSGESGEKTDIIDYYLGGK